MEEWRKTAALALLSILGSLTALLELNACNMNISNAVYQGRRRCMPDLVPSSKQLSRKRRQGRIRGLWVRPSRSKVWWNNFLNDAVVPSEWGESFRMSKETFMSLCDDKYNKYSGTEQIQVLV